MIKSLKLTANEGEDKLNPDCILTHASSLARLSEMQRCGDGNRVWWYDPFGDHVPRPYKGQRTTLSATVAKNPVDVNLDTDQHFVFSLPFNRR